MCNAAGCTFCALVSVFGAFMMFVLGVCIKNNYPYIGEWYKPEEGRGSPTQEQIDAASKNCFIVMAIYIGFTALAILSLCFFRTRKPKSS